ncbi:MAG: hypothetical protein QM778_26565 [Myxococcales bacterium]
MMAHVDRQPSPPPVARTVERHPQDGWCLADPAPLSAASERALKSVVWALLPPPPAPRPADIEARVERQVRCMMQYMPPALRLGFVLLVRLLAWAPVWRFHAFKRLSSLPQAEASRVLAGIALSRVLPLRMMMLAPKAIVLSAYFDQDEVHAVLDYEPRAFIRERNLRREEILAEEQRAQAQDGERPKKSKLVVLS